MLRALFCYFKNCVVFSSGEFIFNLEFIQPEPQFIFELNK